MALPSEPSTPETRAKAQARVRRLTRGAVLAAAGLTALIGVVVAEEHPGSSSPPKESGTAGSTSNTSNTGTSNTGSSGSGSTSDTTTTTTAGSSAPTSTSSRPTVTSGGTSS